MAARRGIDVEQAGRLLREGKLVAFGTETVYGLGANAYDMQAVARVFEAKNRPRFDPLIVHVASPEQIEEVAASVPSSARRLIETFWPGPLTLVLPKRETIPDLVTSGRPTVGVRVPAPEMTRALLAEAGVPVAAPSANPFGRISPTTADHVQEQLGGLVDYIFDCGPCTVGIESTVVDVTGDVPLILRPGGVTQEAIEQIVGPVELVTNVEDGPQRAPGMLSRHYAPRTPLVISETPVATAESQEGTIGLLAFGPAPESRLFSRLELLSERGDLVEATAGFFAALRRLDAAGLDQIIATPFPETGLGRALNDRLRRAATQ